jgi:energy-converting hydrogenase Eha subunit A
VAAGLILAVNVAFVVVFGAAVVAFVVMSIITISWAIRRDRPGREAWRNRIAQGGGEGSSSNGAVPPRRDPSQ